ncbi:hypothetical protein THF1C08_80235 [Vibrio jasicida]|uniref:DNA repair protein n=1 Tax=Vibrio jasicida TaxID=766224 RepID=A0AAU9R0Q6_9VIBR|nr:hypothetical protein THF1C08_80235 [Vibrio jasicida]CAH1603515.1 hypothetical protein THF1A12_70234 [Vibrio jasicida]
MKWGNSEQIAEIRRLSGENDALTNMLTDANNQLFETKKSLFLANTIIKDLESQTCEHCEQTEHKLEQQRLEFEQKYCVSKHVIDETNRLTNVDFDNHELGETNQRLWFINRELKQLVSDDVDYDTLIKKHERLADEHRRLGDLYIKASARLTDLENENKPE